LIITKSLAKEKKTTKFFTYWFPVAMTSSVKRRVHQSLLQVLHYNVLFLLGLCIWSNDMPSVMEKNDL